ncbi:RNA-dependent RNA polymerase 6 [Rhizophagus irregularis DAOM 181602=DAOM 197198]|nr:RNA-dependent RNA polymerase 6 [Rhizophagus irregularis DAOM 181602=DAOM 197198]
MLYDRVYCTLRDGIIIGDKHYEFLAFSASQLRDHSCCVAKCAARMDQCFSSTRQKLPVDDIKEMPDIVRNGFTFSDGLVLEVIRGSTFISAYLNRQAIILLSALGTPDEVFIELKDLRVRELDKMLESEHTALDFLQRRH